MLRRAGRVSGSVGSPSSVVLDVGCGPALPYRRDPRWFVIGLERSFESLRRNADVDLRVHGTATALPLADRSIDAIVCFYSIHHMVGATVTQNRALVNAAFQEFGRVLKLHGELSCSSWLRSGRCGSSSVLCGTWFGAPIRR